MPDKSTVNLVIFFLGVTGLLGLAGMGILAYQEKPIPGEGIAIVAGAIAAISAILSRTSGDNPQPVEIVNVPDEPVPVDPVPAKAARKTTKKKP